MQTYMVLATRHKEENKMIRTNNKTETIDFLWKRAKGETENKDNRFFIDQEGRIIGHGYLQGNGDYFPKTPNGVEITVAKGTKKKDVVEQVDAAMQPNRWCAACQRPIPEGYAIRVELEKFTHHERVWFACSDECAKTLRKE